MRKKIIILSIAAALLCISTVHATLAYFQDSEFDKNVMTVGRVDIVQDEYQRDDDGDFVDFEDNKGMFPVTGTDNQKVTVNGFEYTMFNNNINYLDKIVNVTNIGNVDAYVRTVFAFEMKNVDGEWVNPIDVDLFPVFSELNGEGILWVKDGTDDVVIELDGVKYVIGVYYYANGSLLVPEEESHASLLQFYLGSHVGNEWYEAVGNNYEILTVSQAVQTSGFSNAPVALNTAFGDVNSANCAQWFAAQA
ncbi:MAG: hypothetical protein IJB65_02440 [Clostridia bacterium]|nr:hypothetical protein [Clostridia bacterium]